jgi:hypothetical protein
MARQREVEIEGRRLGSAGHAVVVMLLALLIGLLLDAPGLHKTAYNESPGTHRSVALAITGALDSTSHALRLDRPRLWVKEALGRQGRRGTRTGARERQGAEGGAHDPCGRPRGSGHQAPRLHACETAPALGRR